MFKYCWIYLITHLRGQRIHVSLKPINYSLNVKCHMLKYLIALNQNVCVEYNQNIFIPSRYFRKLF